MKSRKNKCTRRIHTTKAVEFSVALVGGSTGDATEHTPAAALTLALRRVVLDSDEVEQLRELEPSVIPKRDLHERAGTPLNTIATAGVTNTMSGDLRD